MRKTVFGIILIVVSVGMLTMSFNIQSVKGDSGTIYIMPNGSINPSTANITTSDNVTYTFIGNNYLQIVVNRSNVIINGRGHTLQASNGIGFSLSDVSNVTIKNTTITNSKSGIYLYDSHGDFLSENNIMANNGNGIYLLYSSGDTLSENNIRANSGSGIELDYSDNNTLSGNNITANNGNGIYMQASLGDILSSNNITANKGDGIYIGLYSHTESFSWGSVDLHDSSQNNTLSGNNVAANSATGIMLDSSWDNVLSGNNVTANNGGGIYLPGSYQYTYHRFDVFPSSGNVLSSNNIIANNGTGISLDGYSYNNTFFHNNFINNTKQASSGGSPNTWDDGYPSGGNYWSNYTGVDLKGGSYQNESGSDGIGDTPYVISAGNTDHYPLTIPYGSHVPFTYPKASFVDEPANPLAGQLVIFNGAASMCLNGSIERYEWNFGDGYSGAGQTVSHAYSAYGNYSVTLTVVSNTFIPDSEKQIVSVREAPLANFSFSSTPLVGTPLELNASNSKPLGGYITDYKWNFGDRNTTSTANPTIIHTYASLGTFNVTLTVWDSEGLNSSVSQMIRVMMPTSLSVSTDPSPIFGGSSVNLHGTLHDFYGKGLENVTVTIQYTFVGASGWIPLPSAVTDNLGHYHVQWWPTASGNFRIEAKWTGNGTYLGAENEITVSISAGTPLDLTWIYVAIAVAAIALISGIIIIRRKKQRTKDMRANVC